MKKIMLSLFEYRHIVIPSFLWIGVYYDYAHILMSFPKEYVGVYYGVEINFSLLIDLTQNLIKGVIK